MMQKIYLKYEIKEFLYEIINFSFLTHYSKT